MRKPMGLPRRELRTLFRDGVATGLTAQELLERFTACRDDLSELAFATLIARHGPMVMNVCRRMLRNAADADDAFQATFLVLVRRARAVRVGTSLAPWLYGVSVRVARCWGAKLTASHCRSGYSLGRDDRGTIHVWRPGPAVFISD